MPYIPCPIQQPSTPLDRYLHGRQWYDKEYSECELLQGWDNILDVCKDKVKARQQSIRGLIQC